MQYEVELKFSLTSSERSADALKTQLTELGAQYHSTVRQRDLYFAHPARDFAQTDEALRIRCVDQDNCVTYKGPVIDRQTKTRHEIEIPFASGSDQSQQFGEMLEQLGFRRVRTVEKTRDTYRLDWQGRWLELALDQIAELGEFIEIESLADDNDRDEARDCILSLAQELQLKDQERRSYLCMLIEQDES